MCLNRASAVEKSAGLLADEVKSVDQGQQLENPDARVSLLNGEVEALLNAHTYHNLGICTGDAIPIYKKVWEQPSRLDGWCWMQGTVEETVDFGGMDNLVFWQNGNGDLYEFVLEKLGEDQVGLGFAAKMPGETRESR